ncbi:hypothetical protein AOT14_34140 [Stenotrophomonas acidaminiphila]|uniref:Lipoprotein n=1 Tax=Stenotrophomonas acidaminiphila TaxID=128780 RepID=A0A0S1B3V0_9GAMM|nr:hypothetical protein [Stenotrophomonas acidaminiphila]ALJ29754.1 hypothetical protein AOT14_34140 [Stenotrophomonas acidaminiphila]
MEMKHAGLLLMVASLVACSGTAEPPPAAPLAQQEAPAQPAPLTVAGAMEAFKAAGLPVIDADEMTAETDSNALLGRPGQYNGKVNWTDSRHAGSGPSNTVEAFANDADLQQRKAYIERVTAGSPMLLQYIVAHRNLLLRLDKALTPSEAAEYEAAIKAL